MRRLLVIAVVVGAGGFAAASQAGLSAHMADSQSTGAKSERITAHADLRSCRIEKTLKYDFNGSPYMKKVRICA